MNRVPFYGAVIACSDAPWRTLLERMRPDLHRRLVTYGIDAGADVATASLEIGTEGSRFKAVVKGRPLTTVNLAVPGRHNVQNALGAVAVGVELDLGADEIRRGLERFRGADRRFQVKSRAGGIVVVDDYGHHPAEIRATLAAARHWGAERVWVVFQPHRYTRTRFLMDDFARAFDDAERVYVLDIYPASEPPIPGITSERLVERMRELGFDRAQYAASTAVVLENLRREARPGDLVLTLGAGDVWKLGEEFTRELEREKAQAGA